MKTSLFLIIVFGCLQSWAYEKRPYGPLYEIVADKYDSTISRGVCIIEGVVQDQSGNIIDGALISTSDKNKSSYSDNIGTYKLKVSHRDSSIFMFHKNYGEIVIRNYDFKSRHRVTINFMPISKSEGEKTVKKPVIYFYADKETELEITLEHPGMTFMYPKYLNSWKVKTNTDGTLTDLNSGKEHPYLFWEAKTKNLNYAITDNKIQGFLVQTDSLISFFENTLTQLGLSDKEQTDFITFWAPQLVSTNLVFIQFIVDEQYDEMIAPINIEPQPQSQRRVFMLYTPLNNSSDVNFAHNKQTLTSFIREGLTMMEWGGACIPLSNIEN